LVDIGKPAIDYLIGLQYSKNDHLRWEAIKTLTQIADPDSIPIFINALENDRFDVRWLAAEGLIEIGQESIPALLDSLLHNQDSKFLREGVHHVLRGLQIKKLFHDKHKIIHQLENSNAESTLAFIAHKILNDMRVEKEVT
jgi:HEAT repeat protein